MGQKEMTWYNASDPDAYELSQVFQLWDNNWGHVRATCESGGIIKDKCREYGLEIGFGIKNLVLSASVVDPLDIAFVSVLCEGSNDYWPWTLFQVKFARITTALAGVEWAHDPRPPKDAPRERSRGEVRQTLSRWSKGYYRPVPQCIKDEPVYRCGMQT